MMAESMAINDITAREVRDFKNESVDGEQQHMRQVQLYIQNLKLLQTDTTIICIFCSIRHCFFFVVVVFPFFLSN